ncbi:MAG: glyoxalase [Azospira oryzae]|jgi:predicted enzyme related to lactoylglutathione lyase|nr:MAG: glyoxalase [Azospira oryzae]
MKKLITWTEIPVEDLHRAKKFYSHVFGLKFIDMRVAEFDYSIIDLDGNTDSAALVKGYGYTPSLEGTTIYLNATPDIDPILKKVVAAGGSIILGKTYLSPEAGYIAFIIDSEGNKIGLQHT